MQKILERNRGIVIFAAITYSFMGGFPSLWSVFQASAAEAYGITLAESAMMLPMCTAFWGIFFIVGGIALKKMSPRTVALVGMLSLSLAVAGLSFYGQGTSVTMLYILFSLPFGGGCGFASAAFMQWMYKWYADKNGFIAGINAAGSSIVLMLETYLAKFLLTAMGLRGAMRTIGVVYVALGAAAALCGVNPTDSYIKEKSALATIKTNTSAGRAEDFTPSEMMRTRQYYMLFLMSMCALPAYQLMASSIVTLGINRGLAENMAVSMVAISMGVSAIGKFLIPTLSDKIGRKKCLVVFEGLIFVASVLLMITKGMPLFIAYNMLVFVHGSASTLILPFANDMFGLKHSSQNSGYVSIYSTVASFATPVVVTALAPLLGANVNHGIAIGGSAIAFALAFLINPNVTKKAKTAE